MRISIDLLGIVGAGSMGAGIAELALTRGLSVVLVDASSTSLAAARERIEGGLDRATARGRLAAADAAAARARLTTGENLEAVAGCDAVVEAIAERLETKREVFARLSEICPPPTLLATNTSSLRVGTIAAGIAGRERIVGLHFFNPAPQMRLVEVIAGLESDPDSVVRAVALGEQLGKRVIKAKDGIGFLVNRSARPFVGEALRLVQEGIATFEQIDRICRMGGGFRMGPFELADLIGVDINLEISESFWFQSFGEPRWRPSPIQAQLVAAGRVGRKAGAGFHRYRADGSIDRQPDPEPPSGGGSGRAVRIKGAGGAAELLRAAAARSGFDLVDGIRNGGPTAWLTVVAEPLPTAVRPASTPTTILCAGTALRDSGCDGACGFHLLGPAEESPLVEMTEASTTSLQSIERARQFFNALGFYVEPVGDSPGLVLGRIVAQLVNEAAFCLEEGVASAADIDDGARLGLNYPRGPIEWSEAAGLDHIRAVLQGLGRWRGEERYRLSPLLLTGTSLTTSSFHDRSFGRIAP